MKNKILSSIIAGFAISLGCIVNLNVGGGIIGAILFTFGLLTVVHYKLNLYTGKAGFLETKSDLIPLFGIILLGNVLGCLLGSFLVRSPEALAMSESISLKRISDGFLRCLIYGIPCGFIMTTAVKFGREGRFLPLLWGVPLFILAGFYHSIADACYYLVYLINNSWIGFSSIVLCWIGTVIGNLIGCNLINLLKK